MAAKNKVFQAVGEVASHKAILEIDCGNNVQKNNFSNGTNGKTSISETANKLNEKVTNFIDSPGILTPYTTKLKEAFGIETRSIKDNVIIVQYNPSSIKYSGSVSENQSVKKDKTDGKKYKITTITNASTIKMSFTLVFHSKYPTDQSVREQMELILNMIYNSPTKNVKFSWANMQIEGKLVSFSGTYDMFDMIGTPTSGHMDLSIQTQHSVKNVTKTLDKLDEEHKDKLADESNGKEETE